MMGKSQPNPATCLAALSLSIVYSFSHSVSRSFIDGSQCAPSIFNLDQKCHGLSCFWGIYIPKTVQNQSRNTSVIRLPKFTTVNMTRKWHQGTSFSIENLFFFEDYSFGSLMTDVFLD